MNWREEVTDKLRRYSAMVSAASSIPLELKSLEAELHAVQSTQAARSGVCGVRAYEDRLMNIIVKQQELENQLCSVESWLQVMDTALGKLMEYERRVLDMLYIQQIAAPQVCRELGLERSSLYRYRDTALKNLTMIMYGVPES